jgi:tetratricopeptide (TPR) repeat protein
MDSASSRQRIRRRREPGRRRIRIPSGSLSGGSGSFRKLGGLDGQYQKALQALSEGIAADLESGDSVHRADKLLDRAYLNFKRRRYDNCLQDIKVALTLDRSPQRSLVAGTLIGRVASDSSRNEKKQFVSVLREIERTLPVQEFAPLSQIVQARLRGEVLLASGAWKGAIAEFKKADALEAPAKDREYLARGSLEAARHTTDPMEGAQLTGKGLAAYSSVVLKPGQVWQWALDYPPGYVSDEMFSFIKATSQVGVLDGGTREALKRYLLRRANGDDGIPDVEEARGLESRVKDAVPN